MSNFEQVLPEIINSLKSTSGEDFFNALTLQLCKHTGADYTLIARLNQERYSSKTISLVAKGLLAENFEYTLKNTPCAEVNSGSVCIYPKNICQLYPDDQLLIDMKIEGYIGIPLHDSHGKVIGLVVALHEEKIENSDFVVTLFELFSGRISAEIERTDREHELIELANTHESKVAERTKDLSQTLEHLKSAQQKLVQSEKMAALGKLTASIAHEINNPTNFTYAAVYMMLDEITKIKYFLKQLAGGDNADNEVLNSFDKQFGNLVELVQTANEGTIRIKNIVESLRTFSHLGRLKKEPAKVSQLIGSTINLIRTEYRDITIITDFEYDPILSCYPSKLNQVFMNLIINACQAINLRVEQLPIADKNFKGKITVKSQNEQNELLITITDNGCGMDETTQEKIFEPFYTTKDASNGTGLGMSVSFEVMQTHKGSIKISSQLNHGSTIILRLPIK
ncbi:MAG: ATP-binding protein [Colwellia sp.]|nr:ATP-binding protein [Colwellia sp.]